MKIIEWLIEAFFTIKLFLSPTLIGGLIDTYIYLTSNSEIQVYVAYGIWSLGVLLGIFLAWRVKRKKVATEFFGEILSTPDIGSKKRQE